MTGYRSSDLRHNCTRNGCFQDRLPSWDWMKPCLPRNIMPSDLDGVVEINGHLLFIEQKGQHGAPSTGQIRLHRTLAALPNATVWLIRETSNPDVYECIHRNANTEPDGWKPQTVEQMQCWLQTWATNAERPNQVGAA